MDENGPLIQPFLDDFPIENRRFCEARLAHFSVGLALSKLSSKMRRADPKLLGDSGVNQLVIQWLFNGYSLSMVMNSCSMVIQWLSVVMTDHKALSGIRIVYN